MFTVLSVDFLVYSTGFGEPRSRTERFTDFFLIGIRFERVRKRSAICQIIIQICWSFLLEVNSLQVKWNYPSFLKSAKTTKVIIPLLKER